MGEKKSTPAIINLVLFAGILGALALAGVTEHGWALLSLALTGIAYNLWIWFQLLRGDSGEEDEARRLLMKDLEEEANQRRKQEHVKRN